MGRMLQVQTTTPFALNGFERQAESPGQERLRLQTSQGDIFCVFHPVRPLTRAIIWVGPTESSARSFETLFPRLARRFATQGYASLRLVFRRIHDFYPCVLDTLAGVIFFDVAGRAGNHRCRGGIGRRGGDSGGDLER